MRGAGATPLQLLCLFHSSLPPLGRGSKVSLTSVILPSMIPKVPVTLALANELCIYFSGKIQGFSTPFFVPYLLKEGFLSWILSLHPSMKCGICNQCQRKAFSGVSVGWRHKDIFCLSTMSHFLISFTPACSQVREITLCKTSLREVTFWLWVFKWLVWKNCLIKIAKGCLLLQNQRQILVRREWMRILNGNLDRQHLNFQEPSYS